MARAGVIIRSPSQWLLGRDVTALCVPGVDPGLSLRQRPDTTSMIPDAPLIRTRSPVRRSSR